MHDEILFYRDSFRTTNVWPCIGLVPLAHPIGAGVNTLHCFQGMNCSRRTTEELRMARLSYEVWLRTLARSKCVVDSQLL